MSASARLSVRDMAYIALFAAVMAVCAWISVPLGDVPFTLQTFGVFAAVALLGGSPGAIAGMWLFRHKTRHWTFRLGMPAILILQVAALTAWTYWEVFLR